MPESDVTVYATFKLAPVQVSFAKGHDSATGVMNAVSADVNKPYKLPASTFTPPEGMTFAGWTIEGSGDVYKAGEEYEITAPVTFTATYDYLINIDFGEGHEETAAGFSDVADTTISGSVVSFHVEPGPKASEALDLINIQLSLQIAKGEVIMPLEEALFTDLLFRRSIITIVSMR